MPIGSDGLILAAAGDNIRLPGALRERLIGDGWASMPTSHRELPSGREWEAEWWYRPGRFGMIQDARIDDQGRLGFLLVDDSNHGPTLQAFECTMGSAARGGLPAFRRDRIGPPRGWIFYLEPREERE